MRELLRTTDPTVIAWAMALLAGEGIEAFALDVHMSSLGGGAGAFPRRLAVREGDFAAARRVMADNAIPSGLPPGR